MVLLLNLSFICVCIVFGFNSWLCRLIRDKYKDPSIPLPEYPDWFLVIAPISNEIFFSLATILNLNNWTKYYVKISEFANPNKQSYQR